MKYLVIIKRMGSDNKYWLYSNVIDATTFAKEIISFWKLKYINNIFTEDCCDDEIIHCYETSGTFEVKVIPIELREKY